LEKIKYERRKNFFFRNCRKKSFGKIFRIRKQTNQALLIQYGETTVLITATMGKTDNLDNDFFPLTVNYEEKFYAAGKILGSRFVRREGKPSESAILTGRLIDRSIRPLFNQIYVAKFKLSLQFYLLIMIMTLIFLL
jgi:polyribonucleotide nucleotidyltransferase